MGNLHLKLRSDSLSKIVAGMILLLSGVQMFGAGCDTLKGEWNWFTGGVVTLKDDHAVLYDGKPAGRWECTDNGGSTAKLHWSSGFIDSITVSGDRISGVNQQGVPISATRKPAASLPQAQAVLPSEPIRAPEPVAPQRTSSRGGAAHRLLAAATDSGPAARARLVCD
jgi:hypothetical protein